MTFAGLSAFPITPTTADGCVQADALGRVLERLRRPELASVGLLGSTGTFAYLTRAERCRAVAVAVEVMGGSVPLMVGVGALRTDEACALARDAADAGADALLLPAVSRSETSGSRPPITLCQVSAPTSSASAQPQSPL